MRALAFLALVVVVAGAALALRTPERPPAATAPGPTRPGAVRAAVAALYALSVPAITDRAAFERELVRVAAPGAEAEVREAFGSAEPAVLAAFGEAPRVLRGAPLGYRVERFSPQAASVSIWSVVLAASGGFGSESQWRTLTVDLAWTASGWKVTGGRGSGGPDPATPLAELAREAGTFRSFDHVP